MGKHVQHELPSYDFLADQPIPKGCGCTTTQTETGKSPKKSGGNIIYGEVMVYESRRMAATVHANDGVYVNENGGQLTVNGSDRTLVGPPGDSYVLREKSPTVEIPRLSNKGWALFNALEQKRAAKLAKK
jgi:hypothetical protein